MAHDGREEGGLREEQSKQSAMLQKQKDPKEKAKEFDWALRV